MDIQMILTSQYLASLEMLRKAVEACPDELWAPEDPRNRFWHVAYHAIFYTHFYLHPTEADFVPWEKHKDEVVSLDQLSDRVLVKPYTQAEVLEYLAYFESKIPGMVAALDLEAESGFYWLPFNKMELQLYNIRHLQHHVGELYERLGREANIQVDWVGSVR